LACFCAAAICVLALAVLSGQVAPVRKNAGEISAGDDGTLVRVVGRVQAVRQSGGNYFVTLCWRQCVLATVFAGDASGMARGNLDPSGLRNGQVIAVEGIVRVSRGRLQVVATTPYSLEVLG